MRVREVVDLQLTSETLLREDDDLEGSDVLVRELALQDADGRVAIQLGQAQMRRLVSPLSDIILAKEELSAEIRSLHSGRIVHGDRLDTSEADVLGWR